MPIKLDLEGLGDTCLCGNLVIIGGANCVSVQQKVQAALGRLNEAGVRIDVQRSITSAKSLENVCGRDSGRRVLKPSNVLDIFRRLRPTSTRHNIDLLYLLDTLYSVWSAYALPRLGRPARLWATCSGTLKPFWK